MKSEMRVWIKGAGDLATGIAARCWRSHLQVMMTELSVPLCVRRTVSFSEAVYDGETRVEEITAVRALSSEDVLSAWAWGHIPVLVDESGAMARRLKPQVVVDARIAKRNLGTRIDEAPLVIGLGPGFTAGVDVHAVIETNRGHNLGRIYWSGSAQPDTGIPGIVSGIGRERVLYSPTAGAFTTAHAIGDVVSAGEQVGMVGEVPVLAQIPGVLRGLIHPGVWVPANIKIGDVDPRIEVEYCSTISDKAMALGGSVLEAILTQEGIFK